MRLSCAERNKMCTLHQRKYVTAYHELARPERLLVDAARAALREDSTAVYGIAVSINQRGVSNISLPLTADSMLKGVYLPPLKDPSVVAFEMRGDAGWPERAFFAAVQARSPNADVLPIRSNGGVERWTLSQLLSCDEVR